MRYQIMEKNFKEWEIEACIGEGRLEKYTKLSEKNLDILMMQH